MQSLWQLFENNIVDDFIQNIADNPEDQDLKDVFSDVLIENGDVQSAKILRSAKNKIFNTKKLVNKDQTKDSESVGEQTKVQM